MKNYRILVIVGLLLWVTASLAGTALANQVTLNVVTAGDTNMVELQERDVAPLFNEVYPDIRLNVVGTGPGDPGSMLIFTKLKAQKDAGLQTYDIDVAIVHQSIMGQMMAEELLLEYTTALDIAPYLSGQGAKNALGTAVEGFVIPLFQSQVALAYNPARVENPPRSFEELEQWILDNPNRFGYNGVMGGMSGVGFVTAWVYWKTGDYSQLAGGPYDESLAEKWPEAIRSLKTMPAVITSGNAGTLDMLNRGEIDMGPVWVDLFYSWVAEGRMSPDMRLFIPSPGLPGQPMYVVIPNRAKNLDQAIKFASFLGSPEVQAQVIVERYNWYPGIQADAVLPLVTPEAQDRLFKDIGPETLENYGLLFPLTTFLRGITTAYEEN